MEQRKELKLCISYSHVDEKSHIEQFKKHIVPLKDKGLIKEWYDRKILSGEDYQNEIDDNINNADIICLFISANYLSSDACKREKNKALELRKRKYISVIPIILSPCGWLDDQEISKLLALPIDGKPVSNFENADQAWNNVYNGLKGVLDKEIKIRQIRIKEEFESFLQDTEMLTKAHSQKERVSLDSIFVCPELDKYSDLREYQEKISSEELLNNILKTPKIVIAGEVLSGKTTLCKMIFKELRKRNLFPVYISDKENQFKGKIENIILRSFQAQYEGAGINEIDKDRIVPIIDDFHLAKNKERHIEQLSGYSYCIAIVDDIFSLNIKDEKLIRSYDHFKIRELKPSLRYELIKKWKYLTDKTTKDNTDNNLYKEIDKAVDLIGSTLGKIFGKGIMPSYPFYVLSAIVFYETFNMPLDQEITSQGYCYQALIYFYLKKQGVRNDEIDIYINFLTEIAFYLFREKKYELSPDDFTSFMNEYLEKYNLPIKQEALIRNLSEIILVDSFNNYSFRYPYLYYFFVAKYLAEHIEESGIKRIMENIIQNLHLDENAYIEIFITHHSKNVEIVDNIKLNALRFFDKYKPATLAKDEVKFFDEQANIILKAVLPPPSSTPEKERRERLKIQDELEQSQEEEPKDDSLVRELRRAIKTVEVMGCIIKNRAGSLKKRKLEEIFKEAMNVHLRILSYFFEVIKSEENQEDLIDFVSERLEGIIGGKEGKLSREKRETIARTIFWNLNFFVVYGMIHKIVHSLGSDKLTEIVNKVCIEANTPASFIIRHGILMWFNKNLQIDEIVKKTKEKEFSEIAQRVMKLRVVNHCALHQINYKDRQKIQTNLRIPTKKLLLKSHE